MGEADLFTILDTTDSTNNYAMEQVHAGLAKHGMAWFALEQTMGKGQRGKSWESQKGKNIALSIVLEPEKLHITNPFHLNTLVALSCLDFFGYYAGSETKIKWPNDIYWRDRKAGGILIESNHRGKTWNWAIVGIGINLNQTSFNTDLVNPVSLKQITGKDYDIIDAGNQLYQMLMKSLRETVDFDQILKRYNTELFRLNEKVTLRKDGARIDTLVKGVTANGKLNTVDTIEREFNFGEVEWVL